MLAEADQEIFDRLFDGTKLHVQAGVKETAADAQITKRVYPHLLRHSVTTTLLERGMPNWRRLRGCRIEFISIKPLVAMG